MEELILNNGEKPKSDRPTFSEQNAKKMWDESEVCKCEKCGNTFFVQKYIIREVSGFEYGLGTQKIPVTVPVFVCDKCGEICKYSKEDMAGTGGTISGQIQV